MEKTPFIVDELNRLGYKDELLSPDQWVLSLYTPSGNRSIALSSKNGHAFKDSEQEEIVASLYEGDKYKGAVVFDCLNEKVFFQLLRQLELVFFLS